MIRLGNDGRSFIQVLRWIAGQGVGPLLYAVLAVATTWPLVRSLEHQLVIGTEVAKTVPMFNAWTIWWNIDRASVGFSGYWDSPIFYPAGNTFAMSEPQPITAAMLPARWLGYGVIATANLYLLLSLVLNGWFTERLLRTFGGGGLVAVGSGVAMVLLPVVHWQIGVMQLVPLWGLIWTYWALLRVARRVSSDDLFLSTKRRSGLAVVGGFEVGLAFSASMMTCVHHALFLALLLVGVVLALGRAWMRWDVWLTFIVAGLTVLLLCGGLVLHLREMSATYAFTRPAETIAQLSAWGRDYMAVYGQTYLQWNEQLGRPYWFMNPGWLKVLFAVVGICCGLWAPAWFVRRTALTKAGLRRWTSMLLVSAVLAFLFSLGTYLTIFGWQPWWTIVNWVPGFAQVRNVFRFCYFFQLVVVLLAGQGVFALGCWLSGRFLSGRLESDEVATGDDRSEAGAKLGKLRWLGIGMLGIVSMIAALDPWPPRLKLAAVFAVESRREWVEFLGERLAASPSKYGNGVLCLPMARANDVRDFEVTTEWMLLGSGHGGWLVNGYSGFFPPQYFATRNTILQQGITNDLVEQLFSQGVRWIVVDRQRMELNWQDQWHWNALQVTRVLQGNDGVDVYELTR